MFHFEDRNLTASYGAFFPGIQTSAQTANFQKLLGFIASDPDISDLRWAAYMLATVKHECADTWFPVMERGAQSYFDKYNSGTLLGARLGNTQAGDGFRFRGRGYVQITGRANYEMLGRALQLGDQLIENPDLALGPEVAYKIMSYGMRMGAFSGKKLSDYISGNMCDYYNARRIINGLDEAETIRDYAEKLEQVLRSAAAASTASASAA